VTPELLRAMLDRVKAEQENPPPEGPDPDLLDDPRRLAELYLEGRTIRYWQSGYYEYLGTHYAEVPAYEMEARLRGRCQEVIDAEYPRAQAAWRSEAKPRSRPKPRVTTRLVREVLGHVETRALLPHTARLPGLGGGTGEEHYIALRNGRLDPLTGELRDHTPDWFSTVCLPYSFDPAATAPKFLAALCRSLCGDEARISLMQEWFGYNLARTTDAQAFMVLFGEGGTGKSTALAALEAMLGAENVSGVGLEAFGERFGLYPTLGKLANVCTDINELDRVAEGKLKQYTDGSPITFDRKGVSAVTARPTARLTLAANNLPRFSDKTDAIYRRLLMVPFDSKVTAEERVAGMDKPAFWKAEAPGILNWALAGLARLKVNDWKFTESGVCDAAKAGHRLDSDPAREFLEGHLTSDPEAGPIPTAYLYAAYKKWAEVNGHRPVASNRFARDVERVFPGAKKDRHVFTEGVRLMCWFGLKKAVPFPPGVDWQGWQG
jgi:P4 family phage/plasmid primase-like protien